MLTFFITDNLVLCQIHSAYLHFENSTPTTNFLVFTTDVYQISKNALNAHNFALMPQNKTCTMTPDL